MAYTSEGERYAAALEAEPLAPEFDEQNLLGLSRLQAQERSQTPRLLQLLGTRQASAGQQIRAFGESEQGLSRALIQAGLQARTAVAQARAGERRFRAGVSLQAKSAGDQIREQRRARGLALIQSLLQAGTTLGTSLPGIIGGANTQKTTIGLLGSERLASFLPSPDDDPATRARKASVFSALTQLLGKYLPQGQGLPSSGLPALPR